MEVFWSVGKMQSAHTQSAATANGSFRSAYGRAFISASEVGISPNVISFFGFVSCAELEVPSASVTVFFKLSKKPMLDVLLSSYLFDTTGFYHNAADYATFPAKKVNCIYFSSFQ
jgi:hypothetical protein